MASNYRAGSDLERAAKHVLEAEGWFVVRAAGSKGPVDLVAMGNGQVLLIQCKTSGYMSPDDRRALRGLAAGLGKEALACRWVKDGNAARRPGFFYVSEGGTNTPWEG